MTNVSVNDLGNRVSVVAACDTRGFVAWSTTKGTFTRRKFHDAFVATVVPLLNPWPRHRSIAVLNNARIHMYAELEHAIHACGAIVLYLPPYCPHLNSIEVLFGRLKKWLMRHANLAFPASPDLVLDVAMRECLRSDEIGVNLFGDCGYKNGFLYENVFYPAP
jgi:transposase